eukprot:Colp12_sorted_trinity150504_noHs@12355
MAEAIDWSYDTQEETSRIVSDLQLRKYQQFLETYKKQLRDVEEALDESLINVWDPNYDPIGLKAKPVEKISLLQLIRTDNKTFNKVMVVFSGLCQELSEIKFEGERKFIPPLLVYGERGDDKPVDEGELQLSIARMLPFIQELAGFIDRAYDVIKVTVQQLAALLANQKSQKGSQVIDVENVHFQTIFEHLADVLGVLIALDEVIKTNPHLN